MAGFGAIEEGHWVTIEDHPVYIKGPYQGAGMPGAKAVSSTQAAAEQRSGRASTKNIKSDRKQVENARATAVNVARVKQAGTVQHSQVSATPAIGKSAPSAPANIAHSGEGGGSKSTPADIASAGAHEASKKANASGSAKDHEVASQAHTKAAGIYHAAGNAAKAKEHAEIGYNHYVKSAEPVVDTPEPPKAAPAKAGVDHGAMSEHHFAEALKAKEAGDMEGMKSHLRQSEEHDFLGKGGHDTGYLDVRAKANAATEKATKSGNAEDHATAAKLHTEAADLAGKTGEVEEKGRHEFQASSHQHEAVKKSPLAAASKQADSLTANANHSGFVEDHVAAQEAHAAAAKIAKKEGDQEAYNRHKLAEKYHGREGARAWGNTPSGEKYDPANNVHGGLSQVSSDRRPDATRTISHEDMVKSLSSLPGYKDTKFNLETADDNHRAQIHDALVEAHNASGGQIKLTEVSLSARGKGKGVAAYVWEDGSKEGKVMFNSDHLGSDANKQNAALAFDKKRGWSVSDTMKGLTAHELGHAIEVQLQPQAAMAYVRDNPPQKGDLSYYGRTNSMEAFAEAYAAISEHGDDKLTPWLKGFKKAFHSK